MCANRGVEHLHFTRTPTRSTCTWCDSGGQPGDIEDFPIAEGAGVEDWETGFKDTVIAYPDQITTVKAKFDIAGLYVWHCHIVEHEDNEMMRPYVVSEADEAE
jgi:FtsP/CotA-like multicopper oxidase with cupredoxin domain